MKHTQLFILLLLLSTHLPALSQTKKETEDWIKEKITTYYSSNNTSTGDGVTHLRSYETKLAKLTFTGCEIILVEDNYERSFSSEELRKGTKKKPIYTFTITYTMPISEIERIMKGDGALWINVYRNKVKMYKSTKDGKKGTFLKASSLLSIQMDVFGESNLLERLVKAFNHLSSFCPSTKTQEAF